ncbi:hypothetical protein H5410_030505 [Solanum commersonii]|uniref:Uncharacterized protein n=1 Tax=Solanum commersonii TaxID=4109 RepID=A0A9J5YH31_SOLCO|nr:hypothetical protein H5410_030505 [Solanum commersonii]
MKENIKFASKGRSQRIVEQFCEVVHCRPMNQNAKMLKAKAERRLTRPKGGSPSVLKTINSYLILYLSIML